MTLFDRLAKEASDGGTLTRRLFLGRAGRAGAALTGGILGVLVYPSAALACRTVACCTLAYCWDCENTGSCKACHASRYVWNCWDSATSKWWSCVECYNNPGGCAGCSNAFIMDPQPELPAP